MKNVTFLTKLRRLVKSLAISVVFLVLGIIGSSFTASSHNEEIKKSGRDTAYSDKSGFPRLLPNPTLGNGSLPSSLLNPKALQYVQEFILENGDRLNRMKTWGKPYFDIFDGVLAKNGLPMELKYLCVVESSLNRKATSHMGAGGPWQIMPTEARRLGLKVNRKIDERRDYYKSTQAACKFLKELYTQFNDWVLVIAAYNCGPGRLMQAIRKSGSRDFWKLEKFLPAETRNHVKKYMATHYFFEGSGGVTTMTASEINNYNVSIAGLSNRPNLSDEDLAHTMAVQISGKYSSAVITKVVGLDASTFNRLNPGFDKAVLSSKVTRLRLPVDKMIVFDAKKQQILSESKKALAD